MSGRTLPLESATRKKIDLMLTNLGWNTDEDSPDCNVFTERAKTKEQDDKLGDFDPDYVLYRSGTDEPIAIIEAKRKGQDVDEAVAYAEAHYARPLGVKLIFAYDGGFFKSWHTEAQKELLTDGAAVTQLLTEKKVLRFVAEGYSVSEVSPAVKHTRSELITTFNWANNLLRKEGLREGVERFTEFANLLFLKLISEMEQERKENGEERILEDEYLWDAFCHMEGTAMMNYINKVVLPHLVERYNHTGDVFQRELLIKNPITLSQIVDKLSGMPLSDTDSDVKGDAFEYFIKDSVTVGNDLGEYFTPRHIVDLMINLVEPRFGETVYDPTCGTGGFLIAAFGYIKKRVAKTKENTDKLRKETIYGRELTNTFKIAKMNMILTGDGHANVEQMDSLAHPVENRYSVALANPPYGQETDFGGLYPVPSKDGDAIFIQHIYKSLVDGGRATVVIPEGLLFKADMLPIRKFLLKHTDIWAVMSLPQGVFRPYADSKTNIIVFEKSKKGTKAIWFYNLEADGFDINSDYRLPVDENDIPDLLGKWNERRLSSKSWVADIRTIEENGLDLLAQTYEPIEQKAEKGFVAFSTFLKPVKRPFSVKDGEAYRQVKVQWYGKGAKLRKVVKGSQIKSKRQFTAKEGDVVVSKIDAKRGAMAVIPKELDGATVSSDFPLYEVDQTKIDLGYLDNCLRYGNYARFMRRYSKGTTKRTRVKPSDILGLTIYLPERKEQRAFADRLERFAKAIQDAEASINSMKEGIIRRTGVDYSVMGEIEKARRRGAKKADQTDLDSHSG